MSIHAHVYMACVLCVNEHCLCVIMTWPDGCVVMMSGPFGVCSCNLPWLSVLSNIEYRSYI